jgi:hypothetical protein
MPDFVLMTFSLLRDWAAKKALIERDADALIHWFGSEGAYLEASRRAQDELSVIGGARPSGHWLQVKRKVVSLIKHCGGC